MKVPFVDLQRTHVEIKDPLDAAIARVRSSNRFLLGDELDAFEEEFAAYVGVRHCVGVGSGTDALVLALKAHGIQRGDEVVVPSLTFISTALAVTLVGATPIFADVEDQSLTLAASEVERCLTPRTRAVIPVHLYGRCMDLNQLQQLAVKRELILLEDACQAHGANHLGRKAGSMGHAGCFSFYPSKNLGAWGDAGAVVTNDAGIAEFLRKFRNLGAANKYHHDVPGMNSRMSEIDAAVLRVKLDRLDEWNSQRLSAAEYYSKNLSGTELHPMSYAEGHAYHLFVARSSGRDQIRDHLGKNDIETSIHYPIPVHQQVVYSTRMVPPSLPIAEEASAEVLSLPLFPGITQSELQFVVDQVQRYTADC